MSYNKDINGKTILDEDLYIEKMSEIIERDYFPEIIDYRKAISEQRNNQTTPYIGGTREMTNQTILDSERKIYGNLAQNIQESVHSKRTPMHDYPTGSTLIQSQADPSESVDKNNGHKVSVGKLTLTRFLDKFTSEDDASFAEIVVKNRLERIKKYPWLHLEDKKGEEFMIGQDAKYVQTWDYKNRNSLMNVPDNPSQTDLKVIEAPKINYGSVELANTRYNNPDDDVDNMGDGSAGSGGITLSRKTLAQLLTLKYNARQVGRMGPDGRELSASSALTAKPVLEGRSQGSLEQANSNGFPTYKLIPSTPIIDSAGGGDTPLMTWGEVESTPLRQDHGSTPLCKTQGFHMPGITNKEKLALKLTAGMVKRNKEEKLKGLAHRKRMLTPSGFESPFMTTDLTDRMSCLSPAAHRLATGRLRINTNTNSILATCKSGFLKRPRTKGTPGRTTTQTPGNAADSAAKALAGSQMGGGGGDKAECYSNLTDNLLKIPKI